MYADRRGVRYLDNGVKVYYVPMPGMLDAVVFPVSLFELFSLFRYIVLREGVTIVHGHQVGFEPVVSWVAVAARFSTLSFCWRPVNINFSTPVSCFWKSPRSEGL